MQTKYISYPSAHRPSLLRKVVTIVGMVALGAVALMFSAVLLMALLFVAVIGGTYLWWKTRELRKQFKEMQARMRQMQESAERTGEPPREVFRGEVYEGEIIEGEVVREHKTDVRIDR